MHKWSLSVLLVKKIEPFINGVPERVSQEQRMVETASVASRRSGVRRLLCDGRSQDLITATRIPILLFKIVLRFNNLITGFYSWSLDIVGYGASVDLETILQTNCVRCRLEHGCCLLVEVELLLFEPWACIRDVLQSWIRHTRSHILSEIELLSAAKTSRCSHQRSLLSYDGVDVIETRRFNALEFLAYLVQLLIVMPNSHAWLRLWATMIESSIKNRDDIMTKATCCRDHALSDEISFAEIYSHTTN